MLGETKSCRVEKSAKNSGDYLMSESFQLIKRSKQDLPDDTSHHRMARHHVNNETGLLVLIKKNIIISLISCQLIYEKDTYTSCMKTQVL